MTIQVENVSIEKGGRQLLKNFNLEISSDTSYVITGDDEKRSELLRVILGLDRPDSGRVRLLGDYKYSTVNAGVVFKNDRLCEDFPAAVNIALVNRKLSGSIAAEELEKLLPGEDLTRPVKDLAPDVRRIVCIIRACIIPSDVILMDDPFRGLSEEKRDRCISYIRSVKATTPLVLITDDLKGLDFCKRVDIETGIPLQMKG